LTQTSTLTESNPRPSAQDIRIWASCLAGETRPFGWIRESYICPDEIARLAQQQDVERPGPIGLVGTQGVGKSSALAALYYGVTGISSFDQTNLVYFKWRKPPELYDTLLHTILHRDFILQYTNRLADEAELSPRLGRSNKDMADFLIFKDAVRYYRVNGSKEPNTSWAELFLGTRRVSKLRQEIWLQIVASKDVILIDTPDYSKTDKRRMDNDLSEIYWLWNTLVTYGSTVTLIVAIQKEMFHDHFFLDKMRTIELKPLTTQQILNAFRKRFTTFSPFTEEAITLLAKMSRGIFRRFLRYITLTLDLWESKYQQNQPTIGVTVVKGAVTIDHLRNAMENELTPLFRNSSQQRTLAIKIIMQLCENKEIKQSTLVTQFEAAPVTISRILTTLENAKYITHRYDGKEKIIIYKELEN